MRISDWSSDVCSSDLRSCERRASFPRPQLIEIGRVCPLLRPQIDDGEGQRRSQQKRDHARRRLAQMVLQRLREDYRGRKSGVEGKRVAVGVDIGGRRIIKKNTIKKTIK